MIEKAGYGEAFCHRTGHSIGQETHGNGANMDNLETHEERRVLPRTCFSVEPGIYLPEFGVRSEVNVFVDARAQGPRHRRRPADGGRADLEGVLNGPEDLFFRLLLRPFDAGISSAGGTSPRIILVAAPTSFK